MDTKNDLRIIRTYKSLTEAFLLLMSKKHFEDITINELCDQAMIRRTTFYKHFADKNEFFRFFIRQLQAESDAKNTGTADYQNPQTFYISILSHVLDFYKEHQQFVHRLLESNLLPTLLDILSEQITFDITQKLKIAVKKGIAIPAAPEIVASFFTGALCHTFIWWITQKKQLPEETLVEESKKILAPWC